jgi:hypothetical protein
MVRTATAVAFMVLGVWASAGGAQAVAPALPASASPTVEPEDERDGVEASAYSGLSIDTFAAGELGRYLNPDQSSLLKERWIAGFDVAVRLSRDPSRTPQLWLYLETVHGVRSTDVDCKANPELPVCTPFAGELDSLSQRTLFILRNATSLEGFVGARLELKTLRPGGRHTLRAFVNAQAGFLSVAGGDGDALENVRLGIGLVAVRGRFAGSRLEAGIGRNQVFARNPNRRLVIDGLLSWRIEGKDRVRPFAAITVDSDLGPGADAIQTYLGFDFDLDGLFGGGKATTPKTP